MCEWERERKSLEEKSIDVGEVVVSARRAELDLRFERREAIEVCIEGGILEIMRTCLHEV